MFLAQENLMIRKLSRAFPRVNNRRKVGRNLCNGTRSNRDKRREADLGLLGKRCSRRTKLRKYKNCYHNDEWHRRYALSRRQASAGNYAGAYGQMTDI